MRNKFHNNQNAMPAILKLVNLQAGLFHGYSLSDDRHLTFENQFNRI